MLTVNDVAKRLNVSPSAVYTMIESGLLECHRIRCRPRARGTIRITEEQFQAFLESSRFKPSFSVPVGLKHLTVG
jgi:excisionase family DNA binding protein